ncbi:aspartate/glutamate racemase family protein [Ruminococcaceae bacterium OttesenSCG-928-D13]|nr:aspartate/glutamate racemase family protein [Ruminococcaceae bacterium OttesenSCG-928-D13]
MRICIINPNSDAAMTAVIRENAQNFAAGRFEVDCLTNETGPAFIGCYEDMHACEAGMVALIKERQAAYDAFIVACHSDPGLDLLKEISTKPVVGICEASVKLATMLGHSFSVLSTSMRAVPNKQALCRKYGVEASLASVVGPDGATPDWENPDNLIRLGRRAVEQDGCEVLVLGCAGMGHVAARMGEELGVPVLDGVTCALMVAQGLVQAGLTTSKKRRYHAKQTD